MALTDEAVAKLQEQIETEARLIAVAHHADAFRQGQAYALGLVSGWIARLEANGKPIPKAPSPQRQDKPDGPGGP